MWWVCATFTYWLSEYVKRYSLGESYSFLFVCLSVFIMIFGMFRRYTHQCINSLKPILVHCITHFSASIHTNQYIALINASNYSNCVHDWQSNGKSMHVNLVVSVIRRCISSEHSKYHYKNRQTNKQKGIGLTQRQEHARSPLSVPLFSAYLTLCFRYTFFLHIRSVRKLIYFLYLLYT